VHTYIRKYRKGKEAIKEKNPKKAITTKTRTLRINDPLKIPPKKKTLRAKPDNKTT
jgi:hypothetical protein